MYLIVLDLLVKFPQHLMIQIQIQKMPILDVKKKKKNLQNALKRISALIFKDIICMQKKY